MLFRSITKFHLQGYWLKMTMAEGANTGDVEEGSYLAVVMSTCGKAFAALVQLCPADWQSHCLKLPHKKITYLSSYIRGTGMKHSGLETSHRWRCSVYRLY